MSGGGSLHSKDWWKIGAGLAAAAATVATAGGASPLFAGLLGGAGAGAAAGGAGAAAGTAAADAAAAGLGGGTAATPELAGGLGAGAADEAVGSLATATPANPFMGALGSAYDSASLAAHNAATQLGLNSPGGGMLGKLAKAQQAYKTASGLLGGQPQGGAPAMSPARFGAGASPSNLSQYMTQPNSMSMAPQGQMTPEMLALLLKMQQGQGGLYG